MKWKTVISFLLLIPIVLGMPTPEIQKPQSPTLQPQLQQQQTQTQRVPQSSINSLSNAIQDGGKVVGGIVQPRVQLQSQPILQAQLQQQIQQPQVTLTVQPQAQIFNAQPQVQQHQQQPQPQQQQQIQQQHQQTQQQQNFQSSPGYFMAVNPNQSVPLNTINQQGTPIIMQYYPQQMSAAAAAAQFTNQPQFFQYMAPRPFIMQYPQYIQPPQFIPSVQQTVANTLNPVTPTTLLQPTITIPQSQFASTQPQTFPSFNQMHASPLIGTSISQSPYFTPSSRIQIINSPTDLVLNTNEYIPSNAQTLQSPPQMETGFRAIKGRV